MEQSFETLYTLFRTKYCRRILQSSSRVKGVSMAESYCAEVICLMKKPTVTEFADFLGISPSNAHYKISRLEEKGYVVKEVSLHDKREYRLLPTPACERDFGTGNKDNAKLMEKIKEKLSLEEQEDLKNSMKRVILLLQEVWEDLDGKNNNRYRQ